MAAWSGLRPLVSNPKAADTAKLSRDHFVQVSPSGLISITGGKWTTYRKMALDTVNEAIRVGGLKAEPSRTETRPLIGGAKYRHQMIDELEKKEGFPRTVAHHLARSYGDRAERIVRLAREGYGERLSRDHPYLEAEVIYAVREEGAQTAVDVLARRMRLAFLDHAETRSALPRVIDLMGRELGWNEARQREEVNQVLAYLN